MIFSQHFVVPEVKVGCFVKTNSPNSQPSMSLLFRPEEQTFDYFWPE